MNTNNELGKAIESDRKAKGWTQGELAKKVSARMPEGKKVSQQAVAKWEQGSKQHPGAQKILADLMGKESKTYKLLFQPTMEDVNNSYDNEDKTALMQAVANMSEVIAAMQRELNNRK